MADKKKGQEEMVGFAIIMVIVVIAILFFLVFAFNGNSSQNDQSFQVSNFLQSAMQVTTNCSSNYAQNYSVQDLISECASGNSCGKESSCAVLNSTMRKMLDSGWNIQNGSAVKGYEMDIVSNGGSLMSFKKGQQTNTHIGAPYNSASIKASLRVYY